MNVVEHGDGHLPAGDGAELYWQHWRPARPTAVLVNVHGLGDHSGLYPSISEYFPPRGVAVYALDTRGNGRSPGTRGHVDRWTQYRDDLHHFVQLVRERERQPPVLLGHSLGGLMVLDYAIAHPAAIRGVAAAAPVLGSIGTPAPLLWLARVLSRVLPAFALETGLDLSGLARDPAVMRAVLDDPLFHRRASARLATETLATIKAVHRRAGTLALPALILHGAEDRMVSIDGSRRFANGPAATQVRLIEYQAWHALFADQGYEQRLSDLAKWMESLG